MRATADMLDRLRHQPGPRGAQGGDRALSAPTSVHMVRRQVLPKRRHKYGAAPGRVEARPRDCKTITARHSVLGASPCQMSRGPLNIRFRSVELSSRGELCVCVCVLVTVRVTQRGCQEDGILS